MSNRMAQAIGGTIGVVGAILCLCLWWKGHGLVVVIALPTALLMLFGFCIVHALIMRRRHPEPPPRTEAVVEIRSGIIEAFDFPSDGVRYQIPDFVPGFYKVPLAAVKPAEEGEPDNQILVDMATIFLVDADSSDKLREIEDRLFEELNACPAVTHAYEDVVRELGIKFDYLEIGSDGAYSLDVSKITRVVDNEAVKTDP